MTTNAIENRTLTEFDEADFNQQMGRKLRVRREMMRLSIDGLSARSGYSASDISQYESGSKAMSAKAVYELSKSLNTGIFYFWGQEIQPSNIPNTGYCRPKLTVVQAVG
jgi:transcriptional regulator with XRE-family HTH domain